MCNLDSDLYFKSSGFQKKVMKQIKVKSEDLRKSDSFILHHLQFIGGNPLSITDIRIE